MEAVMSDIQPKLQQLFQAFLTPEFQAKSEYYLNSLLTHLAGKENPDLGKELLKLELVRQWPIEAITHWENAAKPTVATQSFLLNLTALLSKDEAVFNSYKQNKVYERLFLLCNISLHDIPPTIKLAYIKTLSSFLEHSSGIEWIVSNEAWKPCLDFSLANQTLYIIREGQLFLYNLLNNCVSVNEGFVSVVVEEILKKLNPNFSGEGKLFPQIEDEILQASLQPTIKLIIYILSNLMKGDLFKQGDYKVANVFIKANAEAVIDKVIILARNEEFLFELYSILYHIYIFELAINSKSFLFDKADVKVLIQKILNIKSSLINNSEIVNVVKLSHLAHNRWSLLSDRLPPVENRLNKAPLCFQNEMVIFQTLPIFGVCFVHCKFNYMELEADDLRDDFFNEIVNMMSENSLRIAFFWRNNIMGQSEAFETGKLSIMCALKSLKYYSKEGAVITFKILVYNINDVIRALKNNIISPDVIMKNIGYFISLMEAIAAFITEFDITWRDSVETICVTNCALDFLGINIWSTRVVVQAIKLLNLSIAKFLSPNLALLVEERDDTTMNTLGDTINAKLCDTNWEIRDSALELVHTIANISNKKYPSYQKMLMDMNIIKLCVTMAVSDSEAFVRASAIKCLQEMIQVKTFWTQVLLNEDLPRKMMHILKTDTEAIVRTEAASLMRFIHEHQSFPNELMDEIYESMAFAAMSDLHWEVKLNALGFWGKVILNHLQDQGFIDGKFPNVTFSKENRKIVTLTESEVKARLHKVLQQLSKCGCLGVFVNALQDDCDLEVVKKSLFITKKVKTILNRYNLKSSYQEPPLPKPPHLSDSFTPPSTPHKMDFSDDIIDQIINAKDINLLTDVYKPDFDAVPNEVSKSLKVLTPEMYIHFIQRDLDDIVAQKTKWMNKMDSLNNLLEDMLKTYADNVNTMDCY